MAVTLAPAANARIVVPYLTWGAGVYVDQETGLPAERGTRPAPPAVAGVHFLPPLVVLIGPPPETPPPPADPPPAPPPPVVDPVYTVDPAIGGYYRPDMGAVAGVPVFCRSDTTWPTSMPTATGYWTPGGSQITMRTWRCDGVVPSKVGTEPFARGLFVLAHESVHAGGQPNECEADKGAIARMPSFAAGLGYTAAAGEAARDLILSIFRAAPLPPPYCLGSF